MDKKPWWKSKMIWTNLIIFLLAMIPPVSNYLATFGIDPAILVSIQAALNFVLRIFTGKALTA